MSLKKKIIILFLSLFIFTTHALAFEGVKISIHDEILNFDLPPLIENNRVLAPVRNIGEKLGAKVIWTQEKQEVIVQKDDITIKMVINDKNAYVDGTLVILDTPPKLIHNKTIAPLRFIAENLGYRIIWNNDNYTAVIQSKNMYDDLYTSIKNTLPYIGQYHLKMVLNLDIEEENNMQFNFNVNGFNNEEKEYVKGTMAIIQEDNTYLQTPYEIIKTKENFYTKYYNEGWKEKSNLNNEEFLIVDFSLIKSIHDNFILNFQKLPTPQVDAVKINNINATRYLLDFNKNEFTPLLSNELSTASNLQGFTLDNYKVEIYINDENEIIKEIISYTLHGTKEGKEMNTQVIIQCDFENIGMKFNIASPLNE